jgi:hypothetical protein
MKFGIHILLPVNIIQPRILNFMKTCFSLSPRHMSFGYLNKFSYTTLSVYSYLVYLVYILG